VSDYTVRALRPDETRAAGDLFRSTLHAQPVSDENWPLAERMYQPGRTLGAFDTELIGTARSFDAELTVPSGKQLPVAAVTGVGVRPDRTRRGVLTELMRTQLTDAAARGVPVAALYASEASIYGRFGYGVTTLSRSYEIDRHKAVLRPEAPAGGEIELLRVDAALERLPEVYASLSEPRPGMMTRPAYWWPAFERQLRRSESPMTTVVHHGPHGPDGYAIYVVERKSWADPSIMDIVGLRAGSDEAFAGLWRYLLAVDLVDKVRVEGRPLDEPTALLFTDLRACATTGGDDDLWLRLVDVPAALAAREYEGEPVVLDVVDSLLPANSGRYRVSADKVARTDAPAELRLGVDTLAMLYFGAWRASALAATGRIQPVDQDAVARAGGLFRTRVSAWCGTHF
jgi:predicted acetyltransferase